MVAARRLRSITLSCDVSSVLLLLLLLVWIALNIRFLGKPKSQLATTSGRGVKHDAVHAAAAMVEDHRVPLLKL